MIYSDEILDKIYNAGLWCGADNDSADLARAASIAIDAGLDIISVVPDSVPILWPWLENKKIKIMARFYLNAADSENISHSVEKINTALRRGADGVQIFLAPRDLDAFVSQLYLIRDDLFFNRHVYIGFDIEKIGPFDWANVYAAVAKMRVTGVVLALVTDRGDKSDFVGRVYAAINTADVPRGINLHFVIGKNPARAEQAARLVKSVRPDLYQNLRFFVNV